MAFAYQKKKSGPWYVGFKGEDGAQVRQKSAAVTYSAAIKLAQQLEANAEQVREGVREPRARPMKFGELAAQYLEIAKSQLRSFADVESRFHKHLLPAFGDKLITTITPAQIDKFLVAKATELSPQTRVHLRNHLRACFNYGARKLKVLKENPAAESTPIEVPEREVRFVEVEALRRLLGAAEPPLRGRIAVAAYCGPRKGEVLGAEIARVDLESRTVLVAKSYRGMTNTGKFRRVAIPVEAMPYIQEQLAYAQARGSKYLFPREDGQPFTRNFKLTARIRTLAKKAGLVEGYLHVCRQTTCRFQELRNGGAVPAVRLPAVAQGHPHGHQVQGLPEHLRHARL